MPDLEGYQHDLAIRRDIAMQVAGLSYDDLMKFYLSSDDFEAYMDEKQEAERANQEDDDERDEND